jgi:hypothetical protein
MDQKDDTKDDSKAERETPGHLWAWAEDRCRVCGGTIGHGLRFLHLGLGDTCAQARETNQRERVPYQDMRWIVMSDEKDEIPRSGRIRRSSSGG